MAALRLFAISDVHTDHAANQAWVESLSRSDYTSDALILAGDVSDDLAVLEQTLASFKERFAEVFFTPGNHEVWIKTRASASGEHASSLSKLRAILALCDRLGVHTLPKVVGGASGCTPVLVVPMLSWHHAAFDTEPDIDWLEIPPLKLIMKDFHACSWAPTADEDVAGLLDSMNEARFRSAGFDASAARAAAPHVVSFSHFLPRLELIPEKRYLFYPNLPKAVGSTFLRRRVEALRPDVHVFGHTHFGWDATLDGIRYLQAALAYPKERDMRLSTLAIGALPQGPLLVYDSAGEGSFAETYRARWSEHYKEKPREPTSREVPSWVASRYRVKQQKA